MWLDFPQCEQSHPEQPIDTPLLHLTVGFTWVVHEPTCKQLQLLYTLQKNRHNKYCKHTDEDVNRRVGVGGSISWMKIYRISWHWDIHYPEGGHPQQTKKLSGIVEQVTSPWQQSVAYTWSIESLIINLSTRLTWVVNFTPWLLYPPINTLLPNE